MSSAVQIITIDENSAGQRLDNFLIKILKGAPKSLIYRIIRKGEVRVNKGRAKPERKLTHGDLVRVPPVNLSAKVAPAKLSDDLTAFLKNAILFENKDFMVVNKPAGLAVHGGSGIQMGLVEALRQLGGEGCYRELVHRLDRGTSGCILVAKRRPTLRYLHALLRDAHQIKKTYLALVYGQWPKHQQWVDIPLKRIELKSGEHIVKAASDGKSSKTKFTIKRKFDLATLVEASPITGRTHQIRVHAQYAGFPLLGDDKYGMDSVNEDFRKTGLKRLFLHAYSLRFPLADGTPFYVEAPLPVELESVIDQLK